jgi:ubiquinone/menaquinone biosynthesis C-methylase UbiE
VACKSLQDPCDAQRQHGNMTDRYVHGYSEREGARLLDQASTLAELLHGDTRYPPGSSVLEAGCGVGAQTAILARNNPGARFTSVDLSPDSLDQARARVLQAGLRNVKFQRADLLDLPFPEGHFDHTFVCFVLEHLPDPARALASLASRLRPGGTLTVIEGDHGSAFFHPDGPEARRAIGCLVELQARAGGDALVGRKLHSLLSGAGLAAVTVSPRTAYADASRPGWVDGFTRNTFTAMVEGVRDRALALGLMEASAWDQGIAQLRRTTEEDGSFCYTFFKGLGVRREPRRGRRRPTRCTGGAPGGG